MPKIFALCLLLLALAATNRGAAANHLGGTADPVQSHSRNLVFGDESQIRSALTYFLERVVPVAEDAGVKLAMHPDDPPIPSLRGLARIMYHPDAFDRLIEIVPSPANGICFCKGTFRSMGVEIVPTIRRFADHIHFVHFRDVEGVAPTFRETFHDNGPTDMPAAMRAYRDIGYDGPMRPDHVPQLEGEADGEPGYTMLGRLFAAGYMRGLIEAVRSGRKRGQATL